MTHAVLHDFDSRNDPKLLKLRIKKGYEAYGIFWALIEMMGEASSEDFKLEIDSAFLAAALYAKPETLEGVIDYCITVGLFESDSTHFWSPALIRRMDAWEKKREKFAEGGRKSGESRRAKREAPPAELPSDTSGEEELSPPPSSLPSEEASETETSDVVRTTSLEGSSKVVRTTQFELQRNSFSNTNTNGEGGSGGKPRKHPPPAATDPPKPNLNPSPLAPKHLARKLDELRCRPFPDEPPTDSPGCSITDSAWKTLEARVPGGRLQAAHLAQKIEEWGVQNPVDYAKRKDHYLLALSFDRREITAGNVFLDHPEHGPGYYKNWIAKQLQNGAKPHAEAKMRTLDA